MRSSHVHLFIWVFNAPNIENKNAYIEFIKKTIKAYLTDNLNNPGLFEDLPSSFRKYNENECHFSYGWYSAAKKLIAKPLDSKFTNNEKKNVLIWRNTLPLR